MLFCKAINETLHYIGSITSSGPMSPDGRVRYRLTAGFQQDAGYFGRSFRDDTNYSNNNQLSESIDWLANRKLTIQTDGSYIFTRIRDNSEAIIDPPPTLCGRRKSTASIQPDPRSFQKETLLHGRVAAIYQFSPDLAIRVLFNTSGRAVQLRFRRRGKHK